jgi:thiosulfate dehydrogenase [quinone] large subunit
MFEQRIYTNTATPHWEETPASVVHYRELAYALLRVTLAVLFLFSGINKIAGGVGGFASKMTQDFNGILPSFAVTPFAYALPFVEAAVGALLMIGLFNIVVLAAAGFLMIALTFGTVMQGNFPTVAHNVMYAFFISMLLALADYNGYSVDRLLRKGS